MPEPQLVTIGLVRSSPAALPGALVQGEPLLDPFRTILIPFNQWRSSSLTSAPVQFTAGYETVSAVLIPSRSVWKYLDNGSDQGTNWSQPPFNDAAWASGPARLGYGGDGEDTTVGFGPNALGLLKAREAVVGTRRE